MALYKNSRYADDYSRDEMLVRENGTQVRTLTRRPSQTGKVNTVVHIWRAGDRIDMLAHNYLGDPQQYWRILDANPEIANAHTIKPGTAVRVPSG